MNDLLLLLRVSRPVSWIVGLPLFLTGFYVSGAAFSAVAYINILFLLLFPLIIFGLNDVYDYKTDSFSPRKKSLIEGYVLPKNKHAFIKKAVLLSAVALILFSVATLNTTNIAATVFVVFLAYAYSAPPLRLKEVPILDSLSNGVIIMMLLLIGFSYGGVLAEFPLKMVYASMGAAAVHAIGALWDYSSDKSAGVRTIATFFGKRFSALFAAAIVLAILLFSGIMNAALNAYLVLILALTLIIFAVPDEKLVRRLATISFYGLMVAMAVFIYQQFYI